MSYFKNNLQMSLEDANVIFIIGGPGAGKVCLVFVATLRGLLSFSLFCLCLVLLTGKMTRVHCANGWQMNMNLHITVLAIC